MPAAGRNWVERWSGIGLLALAAASYLVSILRTRDNVADDAYISFRFAQHLADGHGLVWNLSGPPTEGYTNFLWVLILAGCRAVGLDLEAIVPVFMAGATLGTVLVCLVVTARYLGGMRALPIAVVALYLTDPYTAMHTVSGLETLLASAIVAMAAGLTLGLLHRPTDSRAIVLALACALAVLVRPELAIISAGLMAAVLSAWRMVGMRRVAMCAGTIAVLLAGYAWWKIQYFGYLFPNPFYVKSSPDTVLAFAGWRYVARFFAHVAGQMWPVWVPLAVLIAWQRRIAVDAFATVKSSLLDAQTRPWVLALTVPPVLAWAYYLTIIHEVGFASRFSFPTYPFLILGGMAAASFLATRRLFSSTAQRVVILLVAAAILVRTEWKTAAAPAAFPADLHGPIAQTLAGTNLGAQLSVQFFGIGLVGYRSDVNVIDPVGLADNELCGRVPLTRESYERILWSRSADVYLSAEPPASAGANGPDDDPIMSTPYMGLQLGDRPLADSMTWRHPRFGPTTLDERRAFLHRRMRMLRDDWTWLGEHRSESLWANLGYRLFVYVRRDSPLRAQLLGALGPLADVPAGAVDFQSLPPRRP